MIAVIWPRGISRVIPSSTFLPSRVFSTSISRRTGSRCAPVYGPTEQGLQIQSFPLGA